MEDINAVLGQNLRTFREEKKLSLDKVAEMTGVSKAMLGQIERGESSPTITTVWKIANGLKISFTSLLQKPQIDTTVIPKSEIQPLVEDDGRYRIYPFFPIESDRRFEMYAVEMDRGAVLHAEPHMEGTQEFVTVFDGELTICLDEHEYTVQPGDSIRFRADVPHAYENRGTTLIRVSMVIHYPASSHASR
ncbi:helix-turn-helix domain-containing protein [Alicyclobacillus fastidiosus]|uniref:XRE family transcriptional regulator n=1 Tax=Alicyclobacillus fastidiosus TaxID=392011 RepID=A0ABV5AA82_9BACL|nr:XRE family transcriptional regulator [Alicyclobacillus fastidiosus]WEH07731.1 XRE family transcriptional regulator [Alicyclobacillus fastidiosus]